MRRARLLISSFWPLWAFLGFLRSGRVDKYYPYLLFFFVFYGSLLVLPETGDATRHFKRFQSFAEWEWADFWNALGKIFSLNSTEYTDVYLLVSNFLISRISDTASIYFGFHALVYGLVYLAALRLILRQITVTRHWMLHVIFILLVFAAPLAKIQYVRFFLALWLYVYGVILILKQGKRLGILYIIFAILVHFSFALPGFLFLLFWPLKRYLFLWFIVSLISYTSNNMLSSYRSDIVQLSTEEVGLDYIFANKMNTYVGNDNYIESRSSRFETRRWYTRYGFYMANALAGLSLLVFISHRYKSVQLTEFSRVFFAFSLFCLTLSQLGFAFASVGERFQQLFIVVALIFLLELFSNPPPMLIRIGFVLALPVFAVFLAMALREMLVLADTFTLIGNPYIAYFVERQSILLFLE